MSVKWECVENIPAKIYLVPTDVSVTMDTKTIQIIRQFVQVHVYDLMKFKNLLKLDDPSLTGLWSSCPKLSHLPFKMATIQLSDVNLEISSNGQLNCCYLIMTQKNYIKSSSLKLLGQFQIRLDEIILRWSFQNIWQAYLQWRCLPLLN